MSLPKTFLAIGIAIIFALFIGYTLDVIYKEPSYGDYKKENVSYTETRNEYDAAKSSYQLNLFVILSVIGIIAIIAGLYLHSYEGIGSGILGGGVLTATYGFIRSWQTLDEYFKIFLLFLILILLIYLGYKKLDKRIKK